MGQVWILLEDIDAVASISVPWFLVPAYLLSLELNFSVWYNYTLVLYFITMCGLKCHVQNFSIAILRFFLFMKMPNIVLFVKEIIIIIYW